MNDASPTLTPEAELAMLESRLADWRQDVLAGKSVTRDQLRESYTILRKYNTTAAYIKAKGKSTRKPKPKVTLAGLLSGINKETTLS